MKGNNQSIHPLLLKNSIVYRRSQWIGSEALSSVHTTAYYAA